MEITRRLFPVEYFRREKGRKRGGSRFIISLVTRYPCWAAFRENAVRVGPFLISGIQRICCRPELIALNAMMMNLLNKAATSCTPATSDDATLRKWRERDNRSPMKLFIPKGGGFFSFHRQREDFEVDVQ